MAEIIASQTPPILHRPTEKERKYDRQLRLWAASGQAALEASHILLVNSGAGTVGVEALKNLVLPGIGRFTIYDEAVVEDADLGVNFFLDDGCLGKSRAESCTKLLGELNPEVQGDWEPKRDGSTTLSQLLATNTTFSMILYTFPIEKQGMEILEAYGREHRTPLVAIHSAGFYSYFRIHLPGAFPIVDTHPEETATTDLRLLAPWPELSAFAEDLTNNIEKLDDHDHGHLPYVAILLYYLEQWKQAHGGAYPTTYSDKTAFKRILLDATRMDTPEGGEENFDEAIAATMKALNRPTLPSGLKEVFEHQRQSDERNSNFWITADAIKLFYEKHGCLPVPGNVPDMKATSETFIKLQNIYKAKARKDAAEVLEIAQSLPRGGQVDPGEVDLFCKNAAFVKLIDATTSSDDRLASLAAEELANDAFAQDSMMPLSLVPIYLALRSTAHVVEPSEAQPILAEMSKIVPEAEQNERLAEAAEEVARAAGGELHNVSALTGGMVAQEVIKVITKQYIPIDNTCIFDGKGSRCQVLRL